MLPLLESVVQSSRPLLVIAEDVEGEAARHAGRQQAARRPQGGVRESARLRGPPQGDGSKTWPFSPAGQVVSEDLGIKLENVSLDMLGRAKKITIDKDNTTLVDGDGGKDDIEGRCLQIRQQIDETTSDYDREKLQERLAKLAGGVAVIKVGGATEIEVKERKGPRRRRAALHPRRGRGRHRHRRRGGAAQRAQVSRRRQGPEQRPEGRGGHRVEVASEPGAPDRRERGGGRLHCRRETDR